MQMKMQPRIVPEVDLKVLGGERRVEMLLTRCEKGLGILGNLENGLISWPWVAGRRGCRRRDISRVGYLINRGKRGRRRFHARTFDKLKPRVDSRGSDVQGW